MAAAAPLLLLVALLSNTDAEVLQRAELSRRFVFDKPADYCSISRWSGEGRELLFNSSKPLDFRLQRNAAFEITSLQVSDSGQYQEQCWTRGNLTHQRNSTLLVCDVQKARPQLLYPFAEHTVELTCDGVGPNQSVQWATERCFNKAGNCELALADDQTFLRSKLWQVKEPSSLLVTAFLSSTRRLVMTFYCLERSQQRCDVLGSYFVVVRPEYIFRSVGQSLELNCPDVSGNQTHVWRIENSVMDDENLSHNCALVLPSLTLNHTGRYIYEHSDGSHDCYNLHVCPESEPPAEVFFTGGENLTLQCGHWEQTAGLRWFMRSNRTEGRVSGVSQLPDIYRSNTSLVIRNVSLESSGEFWCMVEKDKLCVFRAKILLVFGEPGIDHYLVRSVLVSVAVMTMCVAVVVVSLVCSTRSREQLPAPVEELEMSHLSPASDQQEESEDLG